MKNFCVALRNPYQYIDAVDLFYYTSPKLANIKMSSKIMAVEKNRIIVAAQNETVRTTVGSRCLATINLKTCVVVLIKDKYGRTSLTHVDVFTDLGFISDEVKLMKDGYTIDVIRSGQFHRADFATVVSDYIKHNFEGILNSRGDQEIRVTSKDGVMHYDNKILVLNRDDIVQHLQSNVTASNPIKDFQVEMGENYDQRLFDRQCECYLNVKEHSKPTVVYDDSKWTGEYCKLSSENVQTLDELKAIKSDEILLRRCISITGISPYAYQLCQL